MGAPSKTQVEAWSDQLTAMMLADVAGFQAEIGLATTPVNGGGKAATSLADMIDASSDPDVQASLMGVSNAVDKQSLPESFGDLVMPVILRAGYRNWVQALSDLVQSSAGGAYTSLAAYMADKSAAFHPLFAEAARGVVGEDGFSVDSDVTTVFAPTYASRIPDRVYVGADGSLSEETTDAQDVGTADITLFGSDDHTLYIGSRGRFSAVVVALSTLASADIAATFQYWNGNAWATLTVTDSTVGFTKNDRIKWTPPSDWQRCYQDSGGTAFADQARLYYIRISRTANTVVTPPVGTCIRIVPTFVPLVTGSARHLGVQQPPLAIVRITGVNTIAVELPYGLTEMDYTRFAEPAVIARALTPIAANVTLTLGYVDQDGNAATQASSAWTAPAALGEKTLSLAGGDTGVRSVDTGTCAATTTATEGVFEIAVVDLRTPAI